MPKIYTRTGDEGMTGLYDGSRVGKDSQILDVLGTLDELSAHIGLLLFFLRRENVDFVVEFLVRLQQTLLNIGSIVATPNVRENTKLPSITEKHIEEIESLIDQMDNSIQPLTTFLIQDGKNESESQSHICRTVTRRTERELNKFGNLGTNIFKFINRLSDFFFTLARYMCR